MLRPPWVHGVRCCVHNEVLNSRCCRKTQGLGLRLQGSTNPIKGVRLYTVAIPSTQFSFTASRLNQHSFALGNLRKTKQANRKHFMPCVLCSPEQLHVQIITHRSYVTLLTKPLIGNMKYTIFLKTIYSCIGIWIFRTLSIDTPYLLLSPVY